MTISGAAAGGYGATLKSYSITGGGYTGSTAEYTTGVLNTAGTTTFTGKVTDSRGRTASKTVSVTVEDYAPPVIRSASAARCDASGSLQDDGAYVLVTHSLTYSSLGGGEQPFPLVPVPASRRNQLAEHPIYGNGCRGYCRGGEYQPGLQL